MISIKYILFYLLTQYLAIIFSICFRQVEHSTWFGRNCAVNSLFSIFAHVSITQLNHCEVTIIEKLTQLAIVVIDCIVFRKEVESEKTDCMEINQRI